MRRCRVGPPRRPARGSDHFASGVPLSAGSSQASAFTSATTVAANARGRPGRGRSRSPSRPCSQNRRRHLRTVSSVTPRPRAIAAFAAPSAAANTIRARSTSRCSPLARRARASNSRRCPSQSTIRCGLITAMVTLSLTDQSGHRCRHASAVRQIMGAVPARLPDSTKNSLRYRLITRTRERWPQLADLSIRHRGQFAYIDGRATRWHHAAPVPAALRRLGEQLGLRDPPRQPRRLRRCPPAQRVPRRHPRRSPRLRLRPLPQRPHRLDPTPDELTGVTTSDGSRPTYRPIPPLLRRRRTPARPRAAS